jgi:hypothetical protein
MTCMLVCTEALRGRIRPNICCRIDTMAYVQEIVSLIDRQCRPCPPPTTHLCLQALDDHSNLMARPYFPSRSNRPYLLLQLSDRWYPFGIRYSVSDQVDEFWRDDQRFDEGIERLRNGLQGRFERRSMSRVLTQSERNYISPFCLLVDDRSLYSCLEALRSAQTPLTGRFGMS